MRSFNLSIINQFNQSKVFNQNRFGISKLLKIIYLELIEKCFFFHMRANYLNYAQFSAAFAKLHTLGQKLAVEHSKCQKMTSIPRYTVVIFVCGGGGSQIESIKNIEKLKIKMVLLYSDFNFYNFISIYIHYLSNHH